MATITSIVSQEMLFENILRQAREADTQFARGMVKGRLLMLENLFYGYDECTFQAVRNEVNYLFNREPNHE